MLFMAVINIVEALLALNVPLFVTALWADSRDRAVGIATVYGLDD
jgi:hypothetical protein